MTHSVHVSRQWVIISAYAPTTKQQQ